jgi:cysteine desulfurase
MLEKNGKAMVTYIPVDEKGFINPKLIRENIKANTVLISIMYANNEIGTIQNIDRIGYNPINHAY